MAINPDAIPNIIRKRGDTWEPIEGIATDKNGPFDLTGATLRFLGRTVDAEGAETIIDSDSTTPDHGTCVNLVTENGGSEGDEIQMIFPPDSGIVIDVPEFRGRWRFEPSEDGVSLEGLYEFEIEATKDGKKITFPSDDTENPLMKLSPDIA
jgi:hypothetical protein